jgi:hypothetical protein
MFGGLATPPGTCAQVSQVLRMAEGHEHTLHGSLVTKKLHRWTFSQCSASASRSKSSPMGHPHPDSKISCSEAVGRAGPAWNATSDVSHLLAVDGKSEERGWTMGNGLTPALKRRLIPRHSRKVLPNPPRHLLVRVDADHAPRHRVLHPVPARRGRGRPRPGIARSHDQDVPEARFRALGRERPP